MSFKAVKEFFTRKPLHNIFIIYLVDGLFVLFPRKDKQAELEKKAPQGFNISFTRLLLQMRICIASGFYYRDPFNVTSCMCT